MANALKLTQLSISEIKLDEFGEFVMKSGGDNSLIIVGPNDLCILELMHCTSSLSNIFPFKQIYGEIPKGQPLKSLIHRINLSNIYEKCNVQESQELALEPIYVGEYAVEPPKARIIHVELVPTRKQQELQQQKQLKLWTVLTSYGVCDLMHLTAITKECHYMDTNLSTLLINDIFPIMKTSSNPLTTYNNLRDHINQYWITYFCWHKSNISNENGMNILYLGTAAGYIIVLQYNSHKQNFQECCCHEQVTKIRIVYMYNIDNFLLIVDGQGVIQLLQINHVTGNVKKCQYLWARQDRITCHTAVMTSLPQTNSYLAIFFKGAHLFVNHFNKDGIELSKNKLFLNDVKITALELVNATEFIITTIAGNIKLIQIHIQTNTNELKLVEKTIQHEFDVKHYQLLGICATKNRYLWSILLYRKKEYTHYSKFSNNSVFVSVCKLNNKDLIKEIDRAKIHKMEDITDLLTVITLDLLNDKSIDTNYNQYLDLKQLLTTTKTSITLELNDALLQKLQIKFIILQHQVKQQRFKYKMCKRQTLVELEFLESVIQLIQILERLKYLHKFNKEGRNQPLSSFQQLSVVCMLNKWDLLMATLKSLETDENPLNNCITTIIPIFMHEQILNCPWDITMLQSTKEECNICNDTLDDFNTCKQMHVIKRCSISYVQLPLFHKRFCPQCFAIVMPAGNHFNLEELFPKNYPITCAFCRFSLIQDDL